MIPHIAICCLYYMATGFYYTQSGCEVIASAKGMPEEVVYRECSTENRVPDWLKKDARACRMDELQIRPICEEMLLSK